jgi:hypothetical protein
VGTSERTQSPSIGATCILTSDVVCYDATREFHSASVEDGLMKSSGAIAANAGQKGPQARSRTGSLVVAFASFLVGVGLVALVVMLSPFASSSESSEFQAAEPKAAPIDGKRAFGYLQQIAAIGPRIAGSEANTRQRNLVAEHFRKLGGTIREQPFAAVHPLTGKKVTMVNLVGSWHPERTDRVLIAAHYDTRPYPDEENDPRLRRAPFFGANDGASGVALLMEIAHHLKEFTTPWGVDLVLFDGEELLYEDERGRAGEYFLGSKAFAAAYEKFRRSPSSVPKTRPLASSKTKTTAAPLFESGTKYAYGFVLDMVGGKDMIMRMEPSSEKLAGDLLRQVWSVSKRLNPPATSFRDEKGREVTDDHLALNAVGVPTIDLIDFEYPHWHRASDIVENCGPEGLEQVGRVVTGWLSLPKPPPKRRAKR